VWLNAFLALPLAEETRIAVWKSFGCYYDPIARPRMREWLELIRRELAAPS
jgi:hypothetical protein